MSSAASGTHAPAAIDQLKKNLGIFNWIAGLSFLGGAVMAIFPVTRKYGLVLAGASLPLGMFPYVLDRLGPLVAVLIVVIVIATPIVVLLWMRLRRLRADGIASAVKLHKEGKHREAVAAQRASDASFNKAFIPSVPPQQAKGA